VQGNYQDALNKLDAFNRLDRINPSDRYRHSIYRAMNLDELIGLGVDTSFSSLAASARHAGCVDEALLLHALFARSLSASGHPRAALTEIAGGIRLHIRRACNCEKMQYFATARMGTQ
jgi:hypothetical protein